MKTPGNKEELVDNLLSQDPPAADKLQQHREILFRKIERHVLLGKVAGGTIYIIFFSAAFWAFLQRERTSNAVHSILWGSVSLHILLWFLVYFLRSIYRQLAQLVDKKTDAAGKQNWRRQDRFITTVAVLVFAFSSYSLYRSFLLTDPLPVARDAAHFFWATVFFIFWYPFGTASLVAKLWLKHKKMELNMATLKGEDSENQQNDQAKTI